MAGDGCFWRWPAPLGVIAATRARQTKNVASCNWPMKPGCSKGNKQARPALIRRGALRSTCSLPWERRVPTPSRGGAPRRLARPALRQRQTGDEVLDTAGFARLAERSSHRGAHGANGRPWCSAVAALPPARSLSRPKTSPLLLQTGSARLLLLQAPSLQHHRNGIASSPFGAARRPRREGLGRGAAVASGHPRPLNVSVAGRCMRRATLQRRFVYFFRTGYGLSQLHSIVPARCGTCECGSSLDANGQSRVAAVPNGPTSARSTTLAVIGVARHPKRPNPALRQAHPTTNGKTLSGGHTDHLLLWISDRRRFLAGFRTSDDLNVLLLFFAHRAFPAPTTFFFLLMN